MTVVFYISAAIAVLATLLVIIQRNAVNALIYLILSLLSVAIIFYALGAPFAAALEVIIYAGAILVLFLFVIMLLNLGPESAARQLRLMRLRTWIGPGILAAILLAEIFYVLSGSGGNHGGTTPVGPKETGVALFGPYLLGVELASFLLLAGLVGAYHLGRKAVGEKQ